MSNTQGEHAQIVKYQHPHAHHHAKSDTYFVFTNRGEAEKFKKDPSKRTIDVVQAYEVFKNLHNPSRPPEGELRNVFGTSDMETIVKKILTEGEIEEAKAVTHHG